MHAGDQFRRHAAPFRRFLTAVTAGAICVLTAGCSLNAIATRKVADTLAATGTTFSSDDDPVLVGDALPFSLKLMESVLAQTPDHEPLLLATSSGFTQYAYGWVAQNADELQDDDFAAAEAERRRAKKLYARARGYALRAFELRSPGIEARLREDAPAAVASLGRDDVPTMYWTAAPWALEIALSKDDPDLVADLPIVEAIVDRAIALDEGWNGGALHAFLISYEMNRPGLTNEQARARVKGHFDRALELSQRQLSAPYVSYAESVSIPTENLQEFNALIDSALAVDVDARPEWRLQNILAQRRAAWLRSRVGDLFLEAAEDADDDPEEELDEDEVTEPPPDPYSSGGDP